MLRRILIVLALLVAVPCVAQSGMGNDCTLAGTWYGGSAVAYQLTVTPSTPAGHYTFMFEGMYVIPTTPLAAKITGEVVKKGNVYEGSMLGLAGDPSFVNLPPGANGKLPDLEVGWVSMELLDCNTIRNTIPFFGTYLGPPTLPLTPGIWEPGNPFLGISWVSGGKVPLVDPPDIDMIPLLTCNPPMSCPGTPIVETYHRLPRTVNPALLHHN